MDNFERLLHLIPYLASRPGISFSEISQEFGVKPSKIKNDLTRLWVECGLPGGAGGDLLDFNFYDDKVELVFGAGLDKPLRLNSAEAIALIAALDALLHSDTAIDPQDIVSAKTKIEDAYNHKNSGGRRIKRKNASLPLSLEEDSAHYAKIRININNAIMQHTRIKIIYYAYSRDELTTRMIDPIGIFMSHEQEYLFAWCYKSEDYRSFRLDRIYECEHTQLSAEKVFTSLHDRRREIEDYRNKQTNNYVVGKIPADRRWMIENYSFFEWKKNPDDSSLVIIEFYSLTWLCRIIMSLAGSLEIVDPQLVKELFTETQIIALKNQNVISSDFTGFANGRVRDYIMQETERALEQYAKLHA